MIMAGENAGRPLLPQTAQVQSFTFATPTMAPRENQKNYVFVDEHNRHKRLKVMRACEGCRRRKIKCDAATTNSWPCAACIRLKLNCIPPTVTYDKDYNSTSQTFELERPQEFTTTLLPSPEDFRQQMIQHQLATEIPPPLPSSTSATFPVYQTSPYVDTQTAALNFSAVQPPSVLSQDFKFTNPNIYASPTSSQMLATPDSESAWRSENGASDLSDALGQLKITPGGVAPWIADRKKLAEAPAMEEYEVQLPTQMSPDNTIRIPPEMMPSEEQAHRYFEYFFSNIHPYVPVINKSYFFHQWQTDRQKISPLILEAIFACASLMLEPTNTTGNQWLALASRHEESFKDVPRLSTIQASLLLLKARESSPKRGYFYRSWMTVVNAVEMAKDLELDAHYQQHQLGKPCGSTETVDDCIAKTRVWHMLFVLEVMIGAPQGRYDFKVEMDTVDFSTPRQFQGQDESEVQASRQFTYNMRLIRCIRYSSVAHGRLRKRKDWMNDPEFTQFNQAYAAWPRDLPRDLRVSCPDDDSIPYIPSHFIANLHCYHQLGIIMQHRPQLHYMMETYDASWKEHMTICYTAAKTMCRIQEAIIHNHGIAGLLFMQRGISFTIYAVLTCTLLHLVAITSPDPDLNTDARDFFVRHMRILEQVTPSFPMPEMHEQINALRLAFSADTSKPFELKASFPLGSPSSQNHPSPLSVEDHYQAPRGSSVLDQSGQQLQYPGQPITPPISAHDVDSKTDSPIGQSLGMMGQPGQGLSASHLQIQEPVQWDPRRIFAQWNAAFGPTTTAPASQSPPPLRQNSGTYDTVSTPTDTHPPGGFSLPSLSPQSHQSHQSQQTHPQRPNIQAQLSSPSTAGFSPQQQPAPTYVTPSMWQAVVASSFEDGLKRRWGDYSTEGFVDGVGQPAKRSR